MGVKCPEMIGYGGGVGRTNQLVVGTHCRLACVGDRMLANDLLVS